MRRTMQNRLNEVFVPATQSDQETGTDTVRYVSPSVQHYHPSAAQAWGSILLSGANAVLATGYNIATASGTGGQVNITFTNQFASNIIGCIATVQTTTANFDRIVNLVSLTSGSAGFLIINAAAGSLTTLWVGLGLTFYGDLP